MPTLPHPQSIWFLCRRRVKLLLLNLFCLLPTLLEETDYIPITTGSK
jgi:hypothetical protein